MPLDDEGHMKLSEVHWSQSESESEVAQSCPTLCDPMDCSLSGSSGSMGFSRQDYWSGLPFPSPGDLPDSGIEPASPTLQALYRLSHQGSPSESLGCINDC